MRALEWDVFLILCASDQAICDGSGSKGNLMMYMLGLPVQSQLLCYVITCKLWVKSPYIYVFVRYVLWC